MMGIKKKEKKKGAWKEDRMLTCRNRREIREKKVKEMRQRQGDAARKRTGKKKREKKWRKRGRGELRTCEIMRIALQFIACLRGAHFCFAECRGSVFRLFFELVALITCGWVQRYMDG